MSKNKNIQNSIQTTISELEMLAPNSKIINIPPDMEVSVIQKYVPQCKLCNSPLRFEAEKYYIRNNRITRRVQLWLEEEHGEKFTWESIGTHMKNHCIWDKPVTNFREKIESRKDELEPIRRDPLTWYSDALTAGLLDATSLMDDQSLSVSDITKIQQTVCKTAQVQAQLMKTKSEILGSQQQAKSIIDNYNEKIFSFLSKLMETVDDEQKEKIINLIREFQSENMG